MSAAGLETTTAFIKDMIADIQKGEIKIPQFQRKFVWKEPQALALLDSISNNYPAGSVLLWRTHNKLAVERNIGDFKLPKTDDHSPTDYVLDGQQRITVIYSCLGAPADEAGFAAGFSLGDEEFVQLPVEGDAVVFPMRWLFNTTKLLNFRTGLQAHPESAIYQQRLDDLVEAFTKYKLPVVVLKELTVEEVCPIFERINSSGTKLSMYDLMVAATWSPRFDLNAVAEQVAASLEAKGFESIDSTTILKCLAAVQLLPSFVMVPGTGEKAAAGGRWIGGNAFHRVPNFSLGIRESESAGTNPNARTSRLTARCPAFFELCLKFFQPRATRLQIAWR